MRSTSLPNKSSRLSVRRSLLTISKTGSAKATSRPPLSGREHHSFPQSLATSSLAIHLPRLCRVCLTLTRTGFAAECIQIEFARTTISGVFVGHSGKPMANTRVILAEVAGDRVVVYAKIKLALNPPIAVTDDKGQFQVTALTPGTYAIPVLAAGVESAAGRDQHQSAGGGCSNRLSPWSPRHYGPVLFSRLRSLPSAIRSPSFNKARRGVSAFGNRSACCGFGCPVAGPSGGTGCAF